jgi:hypothetical protein
MRTNWKEDRRYPDSSGEYEAIVYKRLDYEVKVKTKTDWRKLSKPDREYLKWKRALET